jgi:hypothetical protein
MICTGNSSQKCGNSNKNSVNEIICVLNEMPTAPISYVISSILQIIFITLIILSFMFCCIKLFYNLIKKYVFNNNQTQNDILRSSNTLHLIDIDSSTFDRQDSVPSYNLALKDTLISEKKKINPHINEFELPTYDECIGADNK